MPVGSLLRNVVPPQLRARLRRIGVVNLTLCHLYGGTKYVRHPHAPYNLYFDGYRNIGWTLGKLHSRESAQFAFAHQLLSGKDTDCVWDVGANVGFWSLFFAGIKPPIRQIICFEPDAKNVEYLSLNKTNNTIDRIVIKPVALSSEEGEARFFADPMTGATGSLEQSHDFIGKYYHARRHVTSVRVTTVDSEIASGTAPPSFVKIDVEGHELAVLKGATNMLTRWHPAMVIEVTQNQREVGDLLESHGYRLLDAETGSSIADPVFATAAVHRDDDRF